MISIRRRLTRDLLGVSLVLLSAGLVAVYFAARSEIVEQFDFALRAKALAISTLTREAGGELHLDFEDRFFPGFEDRKPRDFFELWSADGKVVSRSESLSVADLPQRFGTVDRPKFWDFVLPGGRPGRAMGFAFRPEGERRHTGAVAAEARLVVAADSEDLGEALYEMLAVVAAWGAVLLGAMLVVIPRVLRRGLRPLGDLGERAARIDAKSLAVRFPKTELPAELQPIAQRLNDLLARLEQSFDRERRVNADLAHELRTPIAELRVIAESALKWPDARDPATDREALAVAAQMESIVERMLALARSEQGRLKLSCESIDLPVFVATVWRAFAARAEAKGLKVALELGPATAVTDGTLLRSILGNLFDNAVEHAPNGSLVQITSETLRENGVRISVSNTTEGLEAADVPRLFERFWRKETARTVGLHVGLGLALVRSFTQALGWEVGAALAADGMLTFTLLGQSSVGVSHNVSVTPAVLG